MRVDCFGAIAPLNDGMNFYKSDAKSDIDLRNVQKPKSRKGVPYDEYSGVNYTMKPE